MSFRGQNFDPKVAGCCGCHSSTIRDFNFGGKTDTEQTTLNRHRRHVTTDPVFVTCRTGYNLSVHPSGKVYGSSTNTDNNSLFNLYVMEADIVALQGVTSGKYLTFSSNGHLTSTDTFSETNYFILGRTPHGYMTLRWLLPRHHQTWYVALRQRDGAPYRHNSRHKSRLTHARPSTHFIIRQPPS